MLLVVGSGELTFDLSPKSGFRADRKDQNDFFDKKLSGCPKTSPWMPWYQYLHTRTAQNTILLKSEHIVQNLSGWTTDPLPMNLSVNASILCFLLEIISCTLRVSLFRKELLSNTLKSSSMEHTTRIIQRTDSYNFEFWGELWPIKPPETVENDHISGNKKFGS